MALSRGRREGCSDAALTSSATRRGHRAQSRHRDAEVCRTALRLDWMTGPQGPRTSIPSPEWSFCFLKEIRQIEFQANKQTSIVTKVKGITLMLHFPDSVP